MNEELPKPPALASATRAMELVRIWLVDGDQYVVISPNLWKDPATWGLMLVDLAKHVSKAYAEKGFLPQEVLASIKNAFEVEWSSPTDEPRSVEYEGNQ